MHNEQISSYIKYNIFIYVILFSIVSYVNAKEFKCPDNSAYFYPCTCEGGNENGLFIKCENNNLASISLGISNIRLPIEKLHLYKCNFKKLYGDIFNAVPIKALYIEDTPLKEIDKSAFTPLQDQLEELHIIRPNFGSGLPTDALLELQNLKVLEISGCNVTSLDSSLSGLKTLKELRLNYCGIKNIQANALQGLKKLERIDFHHNSLKSFPKGVFRSKRDVRVLDISYNNFTKLESRYFTDLGKMTWCNISHNQIQNFGRNPFSRNTLLGWLSLEANKLTKIEANTFRTMRFMRRLFLADNQIKSVGRAAFVNMKRVGTIDLARNNLTKVDFKMFEGLEYCENIDVSQNQIKSVEKHAFKDLYLVNINMSHNMISEFANESFVNTVNVTVLDMSYNNITTFPASVFPENDKSYMTTLLLQYNSITDLSKINMGFSGMKVLNVSYNKLQVIPRATFPKLYELHTIDFSYNNLTEVYPNVFKELFSLRYINMTHNNLSMITGSTFGDLPTVLAIDVSHNNLTRVTKGTFSKLVSIRELFLQNNHINEMFRLPQALNYLHIQNNEIEKIKPYHTWPVMNALLYMDLSNNKLGDSIEAGTFHDLNSLRNLNLRNNSITQPPWQALNELQTLQHLNLQDNHIQNITRSAFGRLPVIFELNLSNNGITSVSKQAFDGLLQLITLNLSRNALNNIPNEAFRGCVSLQTLDISYNNISKVDNKTHGLFEDLLSVKRLNLSHNSFEGISKKMFPYHRYIPYNIEDVDLSYNYIPVIHKYLTIGLQKIKKLNISHNRVNEIRSNVIGNLTKLEILDLSHNNLEAIGLGVFEEGLNLKEIHLQNNSLISVPAGVMMSQRNISYVDLRNNDLNTYFTEFVDKVTEGVRVRYNGNPVTCDCVLRRVRNWIGRNLTLSDWSDVVCEDPINLAGRKLIDVSEEELSCNDNREITDPNYQVNPDIRFRLLNDDKQKRMTNLDVLWYVSTEEDIGEFEIAVKNITSGLTLAESTATYNSRSQGFPDLGGGEYYVCVGTKDSEGVSRPIQRGQCQVLKVNRGMSIHKSVVYSIVFVVFTFVFNSRMYL